MVTRPSPDGIDLVEREAAHHHALRSLAASQATRDRARQDLEVLGEHHQHTLQRGRVLEVSYWRERDRRPSAAATSESQVLDLAVIEHAELRSEPYRWGHVGPLAPAADLERLARTVPLATAEMRSDTDGRRSWSYRVRCLVAMGDRRVWQPEELDPTWRALADDLAGDAYRASLGRLTGIDLSDLALEVNVFSYPHGGYQEPHPDLPEKVVTHVLWFNEGWEASHGGCLPHSQRPRRAGRRLRAAPRAGVVRGVRALRSVLAQRHRRHGCGSRRPPSGGRDVPPPGEPVDDVADRRLSSPVRAGSATRTS